MKIMDPLNIRGEDFDGCLLPFITTSFLFENTTTR